MRITKEEIERRFTFHPPTAEQTPKYARINLLTKNMAHELVALTPEGREQSLALTALEEVRMRANQAIATARPDA